MIELRSYITPAKDADLARVTALFAEMRVRDRVLLAGGFPAREIQHQRVAYVLPGSDLRHAGAGRGATARSGARDLKRLVEAFHHEHESLHTYASRDQMPILRGARLRATAVTAKPQLPHITASSRDASAALKGKRRAYFDGKWVSTPVYDGVSYARARR